jgi:hypothetical protein
MFPPSFLFAAERPQHKWRREAVLFAQRGIGARRKWRSARKGVMESATNPGECLEFRSAVESDGVMFRLIAV